MSNVRSWKYPIWLNAALLILSTAPTLFSQTAKRNEPDVTARVLSDWTARQARISTAQFAWHEVQENQGNPLTNSNALSNTSPALQPAGKIETENRFLFDGRRVRITERRINSPPRLSRSPRSRTIVFNGTTQRGLVEYDDLEYPQGGIADRQAPNPRITKYHPLLFLYRPLDESMRPYTWPPEAFRQIGPAADGLATIELELTIPKSKKRINVDLNKGSFPLRIESYLESRLVSVTEIIPAYDSGAKEWFPSAWNHANYTASGSLVSSITASVTRHRFSPPVSDDLFELDFPVGTRYFDHRRVGRTFIVQPEKRTREFLPSEIARGATQQHLLASEAPPVQTAGKEKSRHAFYLRLLCANALLLLGAFWLWRRRASQAAVQSPRESED